MTYAKKIENRAARLMKRLCQISEHESGKFAALRRGIHSNQVSRAAPVLGSMGIDVSNFEARVVAALFAEHRKYDGDVKSFGETCRRIALADTDGVTILPSFERRFRRLMDSTSPEDMAGQLRSWIRFAKDKGIAVNYADLFKDLAMWSFAADNRRLRWAESFWPPRWDESEEPGEGEAPV